MMAIDSRGILQPAHKKIGRTLFKQRRQITAAKQTAFANFTELVTRQAAAAQNDPLAQFRGCLGLLFPLLLAAFALALLCIFLRSLRFLLFIFLRLDFGCGLPQ